MNAVSGERRSRRSRLKIDKTMLTMLSDVSSPQLDRQNKKREREMVPKRSLRCKWDCAQDRVMLMMLGYQSHERGWIRRRDRFWQRVRFIRYVGIQLQYSAFWRPIKLCAVFVFVLIGAPTMQYVHHVIPYKINRSVLSTARTLASAGI